MITLAQIALGQTARVDSVEGADSLAVRLLEMGLTPGCSVQYIGQAPLGDPLEFELRGYRLSLRKSEASRVRVTVL